MENARKHLVLIVEDEKTNQLVLGSVLQDADYELLIASNAEQALALLAEQTPDIILLDVVMPGMDGLTLCRQLKQDQKLINVPIIFLTARDDKSDIVKGLEAGGHDYVTKPFVKGELLARVKTHLRLHGALREIERLRRLALDANPLTQLPGNNGINNALQAAIDNNERVVVIYCDIDNFKAFNDKYGFARGDGIIKFTAQVLQQAVQKYCPEQGFLGHIGGDDFVLIVPYRVIKDLVEAIFQSYEREIKGFYDLKDQELGYIESKDRHGNERRFPIITLSLAGIDLPKSYCRHPGEVANICAEVKKYVKAVSGNSFLLDRRVDLSDG